MAGESIGPHTIEPASPARATRAAMDPGGVALAIVVLAVPLAIDPSGFHPFLPVKQAVLLFGVALTALVAAAQFSGKAWSTSDARPPQRAHGPWGRWLAIALLAWWTWSLVAVTPRASNPALHLGFGWACWSAYIVVFFAAMQHARRARNQHSPRNLELLLGAVGAAALVMACHACLQAANADPLAWIVGRPVQESGRWRIFTTAGNPDWTAEFLAAAAPIAVWWASRFTRRATWLWLLFAIAILPTGSRLGVAGLLLGAAICAWAPWRGPREKRLPRNWPGTLLAGLAASGLLALLLRGDGYAAALLRWNDFHSVLGRLQLWQASLHLIAARPILGFGLDHFALVLPDGLRAAAASLDPLARSHMPDLLTAHAHNDFLEAAVEAGIPGALLLLALFALGLHAAWRALDAPPSAATQRLDDPSAPDRIRVAAAVPALTASLGVLFMLALASAPLHTPATALLFWLALGCVAGLMHATPPDGACLARASRRAWQRAGGMVALCATLAITVWAGHRAFALLAENRQAAAAAAMAASGQAPEAARLYEDALACAPWDHESGVALASLWIDGHQPDAALHALDRADAWSQSRESWLLRGQALMLENDSRAALQVAEHATAAMPDFLRAQMLQARLAQRLGKTSEATAAWHQILLSPQRSARAQRIRFEAAQALAGRAREDP